MAGKPTKKAPPYRTLFGVPVPTWQDYKGDRHPITLQFVIQGPVPSKKNSLRAGIPFRWAIAEAKKLLFAQEGLTAGKALGILAKVMRGLKPFIYVPPAVTDWEEKQRPVLLAQMHHWREVYAKQDMFFPIRKCSVVIKHYWADNRMRDNSNKEQTIHDLLVDMRLIADDQYQCLYKISSESGCYKDLVRDHITLIYVTAYDW